MQGGGGVSIEQGPLVGSQNRDHGVRHFQNKLKLHAGPTTLGEGLPDGTQKKEP